MSVLEGVLIWHNVSDKSKSGIRLLHGTIASVIGHFSFLRSLNPENR
jgi:hypothetical protein